MSKEEFFGLKVPDKTSLTGLQKRLKRIKKITKEKYYTIVDNSLKNYEKEADSKNGNRPAKTKKRNS